LKQKLLIFLILLSIIFNSYASAQSEVTPKSLTLTLYTDGTTQVDYAIASDPTKVRVETPLIGENFENLIVRDENGNPLGVTMINNTAQVDSIGVLNLYFSYLTDSLTKEDNSVWVVNVTSPVNVTIVLPKNAQFLDMSEIPIEIGNMGESQYLKFNSGLHYVYYLLGLPSMIDEATSSIGKASDYITEKESLGYNLSGARELLIQANDLYQTQEFLEAKNNADDALIIATNIVEYADSAKFAILSAGSSITEAKSQARTNGLEEAESSLVMAQSLYDHGSYRNAEITALQAAKEASQTKKQENNDIFYIASALIILLLVVIGFRLMGFGK
jgi:hypothetical protein